jgi:hypothetical protein
VNISEVVITVVGALIAYIVASLLITNLITGTSAGDQLIQNIVPMRVELWARKRGLKCWKTLKPMLLPLAVVKMQRMVQWAISSVRLAIIVRIAHRLHALPAFLEAGWYSRNLCESARLLYITVDSSRMRSCDRHPPEVPGVIAAG